MRCFTIRKANGKNHKQKAAVMAALLLSFILSIFDFTVSGLVRCGGLAVNGTGTYGM
ncbi:hypothetical protein [Bacillus sp. AFS096315]|uniref:hypothetical protein n=1 Tax=Bacillus sp. AFS096315 TaxID=2033517 RepID=UPI0015968F6F|nr:hypothetical protein [Bacillus sp. AFS096315]